MAQDRLSDDTYGSRKKKKAREEKTQSRGIIGGFLSVFGFGGTESRDKSTGRSRALARSKSTMPKRKKK